MCGRDVGLQLRQRAADAALRFENGVLVEVESLDRGYDDRTR